MKFKALPTIAIASALLGSLAFSSPAVGEFNADALIAQVDNHEARITELETKTTATQAQVEQNTTDIQTVAQNTGTTLSSPQSAPVTASETPTAPQTAQAPEAPAEQTTIVPTATHPPDDNAHTHPAQ